MISSYIIWFIYNHTWLHQTIITTIIIVKPNLPPSGFEPVVTNLSTPHQTLFRRTFYICCTSVVKKSLHVQCHVFYKIFQEAHVSRLHYPFGLVSFS